MSGVKNGLIVCLIVGHIAQSGQARQNRVFDGVAQNDYGDSLRVQLGQQADIAVPQSGSDKAGDWRNVELVRVFGQILCFNWHLSAQNEINQAPLCTRMLMEFDRVREGAHASIAVGNSGGIWTERVFTAVEPNRIESFTTTRRRKLCSIQSWSLQPSLRRPATSSIR